MSLHNLAYLLSILTTVLCDHSCLSVVLVPICREALWEEAIAIRIKSVLSPLCTPLGPPMFQGSQILETPSVPLSVVEPFSGD